MANEALIQEIKRIQTLGKSGNLDEVYSRYRALFASSDFMTYRPQDQRQALHFMIYAKGVPSWPTPVMVEAHRAAVAPLKELVAQYKEADDYEMLGMCYGILGDEVAAGVAFRDGLAIEREQNPQSDLWGSLMKRISLL